MDLQSMFEEMCRDVGKFREVLGDSIPKIEEAELQEYVRALTGQLDEAFAEVQREVPSTLQALSDEVQKTEKDLAETNQKIKQASVQLEEARKRVEAGIPMPEPPTPEPEPSDAELDDLFSLLRGELLDRFGEPLPQEKEGQVLEGREAWEDWTEFGRTK